MNKLLKNRIAIAILAMLFAFGSGLWFYMGVTASAQKTNVVKITAEVSKGSLITKDMIITTQVGGYGLDKDVVKKSEDVVGKYAAADFSPGDLVLSTKLSDNQLTGDTSLDTLDGTRSAISIAVKSLADGLSNKLQAGDIVSCYTIKDNKAILPPELTYVEVLDADESNSNSNTSTVTLLATQEQATLLAQYSETSVIHLALVYRGNAATAQQFLDKQDEVLQ